MKDDGLVPILRTKLHPPPVPPDYVSRSRLDVARLSPVPLTLVSAAAGYGKTTLVSGWLRQWDGQSAWVSLDEHDSDPRAFLRCVCAAVQALFPSAMPDTCDLVRAANLPPTS